MCVFMISLLYLINKAGVKSGGRRPRKPGVERKPRQAYSAKQLERLEAEFKVSNEGFKQVLNNSLMM